MTDNQLALLSRAAEVCARLHMHQTDVLHDFAPLTYSEQMIIRSLMKSATGIRFVGEDIAKEQSNCLFDLYQSFRHYLSWKDQDNTPETRDWDSQLGVCFDEPMYRGSEPPVKVTNSND